MSSLVKSWGKSLPGRGTRMCGGRETRRDLVCSRGRGRPVREGEVRGVGREEQGRATEEFEAGEGHDAI